MTKVTVHTINFVEFDVEGRLVRIQGSSKRVRDCDWPVEGNYE